MQESGKYDIHVRVLFDWQTHVALTIYPLSQVTGAHEKIRYLILKELFITIRNLGFIISQRTYTLGGHAYILKTKNNKNKDTEFQQQNNGKLTMVNTLYIVIFKMLAQITRYTHEHS